MDTKLTENITFEEMTHTDITELQDENRRAAELYCDNLIKTACLLQTLRDFILRAVIVHSGFRYPALNMRVGGAATSDHMTGRAVDFVVKDFEDIIGLRFIFQWCKNHLEYGQLILENPPDKKPWIHISIPREGKEPEAMIFENGAYTRV